MHSSNTNMSILSTSRNSKACKSSYESQRTPKNYQKPENFHSRFLNFSISFPALFPPECSETFESPFAAELSNSCHKRRKLFFFLVYIRVFLGLKMSMFNISDINNFAISVFPFPVSIKIIDLFGFSFAFEYFCFWFSYNLISVFFVFWNVIVFI